MPRLFKKIFKNKYSWALVPVLLVLLAYLPFYSSGGFLGDLGDPIGQTIPNKFLLLEYLKSGIFPVWNSLSLMGFPFLADIQVGTFYVPDLLIFSVFTPLTAHNASVLFHLSFAAIGIYLFVSEVTKSKFIPIALTSMMVLAGSFLSRIVYLNFLETIAFVPWILWLIQKNNTSSVMLSSLIALMIFAGHPVALFYSFIVVFIFFIINHSAKYKEVISATLIGFLMAGIQLVPFLFLKGNSVRDVLSYEEFTGGSLEFGDLFSFLTPFGTSEIIAFDKNIYFGTFAFIALIGSIFFIKKIDKKLKKIYLTGLLLFGLGIVLSLGGNIPILAKISYHFPILNVLRVPARYILISHFGVLLSLAVFFKYLMQRNKKLTTLFLTCIMVNSFFMPSFSLTRVEQAEAEREYWPEVKVALETEEGEAFSLDSPPSYFLSSSFFLFPNRHVLSFMPNLIGYNPMISKDYHDFFPVASIGSFEDPNYFMNLYEKLQFVGLEYYIFPTTEYLNQKGLEDKEYVRDFLYQKGWEKLQTESSEFEVWKNTNVTPFVYFLNDKNTITAIDFKPGEISLETDVVEGDTLVVNQSFVPGWVMTSDLTQEPSDASEFQNIVQSYEISNGTREITLKYRPKEIYYGAFLSLLGTCSIFTLFLKKKWN